MMDKKTNARQWIHSNEGNIMFQMKMVSVMN